MVVCIHSAIIQLFVNLAGQLLLPGGVRPERITLNSIHPLFKEALYIIWCGVNRLGDSGVKVVWIDSAILQLLLSRGQLLLTRRGKTRMYTVGIEFEFYTVPL